MDSPYIGRGDAQKASGPCTGIFTRIQKVHTVACVVLHMKYGGIEDYQHSFIIALMTRRVESTLLGSNHDNNTVSLFVHDQ